MRQLSIAEVITIIRRVTGKDLYHVQMELNVGETGIEEYICIRG